MLCSEFSRTEWAFFYPSSKISDCIDQVVDLAKVLDNPGDNLEAVFSLWHVHSISLDHCSGTDLGLEVIADKFFGLSLVDVNNGDRSSVVQKSSYNGRTNPTTSSRYNDNLDSNSFLMYHVKTFNFNYLAFKSTFGELRVQLGLILDIKGLDEIDPFAVGHFAKNKFARKPVFY